MTPITNNPFASSTLGSLPSLSSQPTSGDKQFKDVLLDSIHEVNKMQLDADRAVEAISTGQDVNPAEVLTAVQKADLAFRTLMQVRNKLVEAYQEIKDVRI